MYLESVGSAEWKLRKIIGVRSTNQRNLLDLDGADLEREIQKIIKENPPTRQNWSEKEVEILMKLYGRTSIQVTAAKLGRDYASVQTKAQRLGLTKRLK